MTSEYLKPYLIVNQISEISVLFNYIYQKVLLNRMYIAFLGFYEAYSVS